MGRKFEFDFIPFNNDQIREMSDEDLYKNINLFKRKIKEATKMSIDTHAYEVEFCYLDHERIMRERAREANARFIKSSRHHRSGIKTNRKPKPVSL